jgi:hypothetical protein
MLTTANWLLTNVFSMRAFRSSPYFLSLRLGRWQWSWLILATLSVVPVGAISVWLFDYLLEVLSNFTDTTWYNFFTETDHATDPPVVLIELICVGLLSWPVAICGTLIQGRSVKSLLAPIKTFRWGLVGKTILLAILIELLFYIIPIPGLGEFEPTYQFNGFHSEYAYWLLPMFFCILLQTTGEDVFFKGFLLRQFGAVVPVFWFAPILVTAFFVSIHIGNADFMENIVAIMVYFVVSELIIIFFLMRSYGMEIPLVLHFLNNFILFMVCAEESTQANELTLWVYEKCEDDLINRARIYIALGQELIFFACLYLMFFWHRSPYYIHPLNKESEDL